MLKIHRERNNHYVIYLLASTISVMIASGASIIEGPKDLEAREGDNITLKCIVDNPTLSVVWCQNNFCTLGSTRDLPAYPRYRVVGDEHKGEHNLAIANVRDEDSGVYQCQVLRTLNTTGIKSREAILQVYRPAEMTSLQKPLEIKEGELVTLECLADYSYPASRISWVPSDFIRHHADNVTYMKHPISKNSRHLWSSISTLTFRATSDWYNKRVDCIIEHPSQKENKIISTTIRFKCTPVVKIQCDRTFPVTENTTIECVCIPLGSCPLNTLRWSINGTEINATGSTYNLFTRKSLHGHVLVCTAENDEMSNQDELKLNITYAPEFYYSKEMDRSSKWSKLITYLVTRREKPYLECYVDSNPMYSSLVWMRGQTVVSTANRFQLTKPITTLYEDFKCVVKVPGFGMAEQVVRLVLDGPPIATITSDIFVDLGGIAKITCEISTLPQFDELYWMSNSKVLVADGRYSIEENRTENRIFSTLIISPVLISDATSYNCCVINSRGMTNVQAVVRLNSYRTEYLWIIVGLLVLALALVLAIVTFLAFRQMFLPCTNNIEVRPSSEDESDKSVPEWYPQDTENNRFGPNTRVLYGDSPSNSFSKYGDSFGTSVVGLSGISPIAILSSSAHNDMVDESNFPMPPFTSSYTAACIDALSSLRSTGQQSTV